MGQRHREKRKHVKAKLREIKGQLIRLDDHRKFENEFGELKVRMTKAEARRRLLFRRTVRIESAKELLAAYGDMAEGDIIDAMSEEIKLDIDRQVLAEIDRAMQPMGASP
jgi:hypothetical protein